MILDLLRKEMKENNIDYYIIPTLDPHGSEYLPDYYRERAFVTGFTGSAGTAVVSQKDAYLWADGRYYIQAQRQIKDTGFKLMKMGLEGVPTYTNWIKNNISNEENIGLNAKYYLESDYENLENSLKEKNIKIIDIDLVKGIWENRPNLPKDKVFIHDVKYAGLSAKEKLAKVREGLEKKSADLTVISSLVDIAWLYNIRCNDIEDTPVVISYAIVEKNKSYIFINREKLTEEVQKYLEEVAEIKDYDEIFNFIKNYENKNIYLDKNIINHSLYSNINLSNNIIQGLNITEVLKGVKNEIELKNIRNTSIRDGVAVTKFIYWLKKEIKEREISEMEASDKLRLFRESGENFVGDSFGTISAYGENAAMAHYTATIDNYSMLENAGLYLVDSGAQYLDGTTDITRTIAVGELTEEEIHDFTLVLKSHIALMSAKFLKGTTDGQLDIISRYPLWKEHENFNHGTGHGVGYFLGVHEGPHSIGARSKQTPMEIGMIVSNEPGIYKEGKHGIRTENIIEVVSDLKNEYGEFYKFNTISFAPIDIDAIDINMLNDDEINELNNYHKKVYENISPYLENKEKIWLKEVTKELVR